MKNNCSNSVEHYSDFENYDIDQVMVLWII